MNRSQIVSFIWGVADLIRDTFKRGRYQDVTASGEVVAQLRGRQGVDGSLSEGSSSAARPVSATGGPVGELHHETQFAAHRRDVAAEGGDQQIAALFETGHVLLIDPELLGDAHLGLLPRPAQVRSDISSAISAWARSSTLFRRARGSWTILCVNVLISSSSRLSDDRGGRSKRSSALPISRR